jgi:hypothetical protein
MDFSAPQPVVKGTVMSIQRSHTRGLGLARRKSCRRLFVEKLEGRLLLTAVPEFSSLPGADHTIYLDFDGQTVQNTNWNGYYNQATLTAPAYDIDGNPSTFSATELARIEEAWQRTSEDFRPFNVNVTTVDPGIEALRKSGSGDTQWGVRVIVTNEANMVTNPAEYCGCGGIAYINSFNWNSDTPVWVYTTGGKSVAEAASHEAGHSLGLSHDGTASSGYYTGHGSGDTSWAPIMGVGYYTNVTQWDAGEYFGSNNAGSDANYGKGPDDLAIITSYNGFGYRGDDHGDSNAGASVLTQSGTSVSGTGIIERSDDVDVLAFTTGSGQVTLSVLPFTPGANLDIQARLFDAAGNQVASSNPSAALSANFALTLTAGQYFLHVEGTGVGNPAGNPPSGYSNYGSLGQYSIQGTVVETSVLPQLAINDVTVNEADGSATFTVSISGSFSEPVSVDFATVDGSASAGSDFVAAGGSLTFLPGGATTQSITVSILDDSDGENVEDFFVNLSNPSGAALADGQGQGTIQDNDASISINNASITEGNLTKARRRKPAQPTYKNLTFTVSLSAPLGHSVSVSYATQDGTATTANNDYLAAAGSLTFNPGETSKSVSITIVGDNTSEPDEVFLVVLSNPSGAGLASGIGTGTIVDNDGGGSAGGKIEPEQLEPVADPFWFFEPQDGVSDIAHQLSHDHDVFDGHPHDDLPLEDSGAHADELSIVASPVNVATSPLERTLADFGVRRELQRTTDASILPTTGVTTGPPTVVLRGAFHGERNGSDSVARRETLNDILFGDALEELLSED